MTCRCCGRSPEGRGDQVAAAAGAFTCARCLVLGRAGAGKAAGHTTTAGRGFRASDTSAISAACNTDSPGQPGLYVVRAGDRYKIGCSSDPDRRAKELGGALLDWVPIPFGFDLIERRVHQHFAAKRIQGEWFALTESDVAEFERIVHEAVRYVRRVHPFAHLVGLGNFSWAMTVHWHIGNRLQ